MSAESITHKGKEGRRGEYLVEKMVKNAYSHRLPYSYQICPDITLWASLWRVMMPAAERGFTANSIVA